MFQTTSLSVAVLLAASLLTQPLAAAEATDIESVLAQAERSLAEARATGNAWTTTDQLMSAAREADDPATALELAQRALLTADAARRQEQQERDDWRARVPEQ